MFQYFRMVLLEFHDVNCYSCVWGDEGGCVLPGSFRRKGSFYLEIESRRDILKPNIANQNNHQ